MRTSNGTSCHPMNTRHTLDLIEAFTVTKTCLEFTQIFYPRGQSAYIWDKTANNQVGKVQNRKKKNKISVSTFQF